MIVDRTYDNDVVRRIIETICGIANVGPDAPGFVYIGVADKETDAKRINELDGVISEKVGQRYVVGIDREVKIEGITTEQYLQKMVSGIRQADISEPLKGHVLSHIDTVDYRGKIVIRIVVPQQKEVSSLAMKRLRA